MPKLRLPQHTKYQQLESLLVKAQKVWGSLVKSTDPDRWYLTLEGRWGSMVGPDLEDALDATRRAMAYVSVDEQTAERFRPPGAKGAGKGSSSPKRRGEIGAKQLPHRR